MGIPAEPPLMRRAGIALPSAIFAIVVVSLLTTGAWSMTELDLKATTNRVDAATALRLAHTAETHAVAVLRNRMKDVPTFNRLLAGFDSVANTLDDGLLAGYAILGDSLNIPSTGKVTSEGRYFVRILNDPLEANGFTDANRRLLINCRGVTTNGSSAEINVVVANFSLPALAVDGNLEISSTINASSSGACGGIYASGNIFGGGTTTVTAPGYVKASGTITHNVTGTGAKLPSQPPVDIPAMNPSDFCGASGYIHIGAGSSGYSSGTWKPSVLPRTGDPINAVYCVTGNVEFQSDFGTSTVPKNVTVIASGSIKVGGKKVFMKAAHPDGIVLMGGGDLDLQGDAGFNGLLYAGAQCYISGKPAITGQLVCKNTTPQTAGADYVQLSSGKGLLISGDATFTFTCNSLLSSVFGVVAWYPKVGS